MSRHRKERLLVSKISRSWQLSHLFPEPAVCAILLGRHLACPSDICVKIIIQISIYDILYSYSCQGCLRHKLVKKIVFSTLSCLTNHDVLLTPHVLLKVKHIKQASISISRANIQENNYDLSLTVDLCQKKNNLLVCLQEKIDQFSPQNTFLPKNLIYCIP